MMAFCSCWVPIGLTLKSFSSLLSMSAWSEALAPTSISGVTRERDIACAAWGEPGAGSAAVGVTPESSSASCVGPSCPLKSATCDIARWNSWNCSRAFAFWICAPCVCACVSWVPAAVLAWLVTAFGPTFELLSCARPRRNEPWSGRSLMLRHLAVVDRHIAAAAADSVRVEPLHLVRHVADVRLHLIPNVLEAVNAKPIACLTDLLDVRLQSPVRED